MKKKDILRKQKSKVFLNKSPNTLPLYDTLIAIDDFFDELKRRDDIDFETKAKILKNFNNLVITMNDTFNKLSKALKIDYNEPTSIQILKENN